MKEVGIIIKHPGRDNDWRIDIFTVHADMGHKDIREYVMSQMLGPFEIMGITERISHRSLGNIIPD